MTPMMEQYLEVKKQYKDFLLFYRLGDFYEMFFDDAITASRELELTLTGRDCGEEERAPMCGVPFHAVEGYIGRLIEKGYKIAICEQMENPASAVGLVKREVTRVVTPGTLIESDLLPEKKNNYICAACTDGTRLEAGVCFADVSTGRVCATLIRDSAYLEMLRDEIAVYRPAELVCNIPDGACDGFTAWVRDKLSVSVENRDETLFDRLGAAALLRERFGASVTGVETLTEPEGYVAVMIRNHPDYAKNEAVYAALAAGESGVNDYASKRDNATLVRAIAGLLRYVDEMQKSGKSYLHDLEIYSGKQYLEIDAASRRNLELTETMREKHKKGSLLGVLDQTETAAGARMMRQWVEHPLYNATDIIRRQNAIEELVDDFMTREELRNQLSGVLDLERLMARVVYGSANARDLVAIGNTLRKIPAIRETIRSFSSLEMNTIYSRSDDLADVAALIEQAICEEPPLILREGGIIRDGFNAEVDAKRHAMRDGGEMMEEMAAQERERTGIKNMKLGRNNVFGYYLEVTRSQTDAVPPDYIRKQTLANCERYITKGLKELENLIGSARDRDYELEYELFQDIRSRVAASSLRIQQTASLLARLDVYVSLATVASKNRYVRPEINLGDTIYIKEGRHPVVEKCLGGAESFVPNDTLLDTAHNRMMLITGPNMAGKSTYMRQVALITVMAQIGSFVPAASAEIGVIDKIFTRVGASDDLASGQSTFMLEMNEVAYILKNATPHSLILYDEVGRGTSTYDGMSIARAIAEYTNGKKIGAKTLFATHYHELTSLEDEFDGIVNYTVAAKKRGEDIVFLRKILRGSTDDSYGIEVARLAGLPREVISRARQVLASVESTAKAVRTAAADETALPADDGSISLEDCIEEQIIADLRATDVNTLSPYEAMTLLFDIKKRLGE